MPTGPKGEKRPTDVNARAETLPSAQRRDGVFRGK
jgi:hypothetical protein